VPLAYIFASCFGIEKVWYSIWISELVAVIYAILASKRVMKKRGIL
jgi:Na+-driven multidrug efflux pump